MLIRFFRYALVAVLVLNLAVDCALARRLFQRNQCATQCQSCCSRSCPASSEVTACQISVDDCSVCAVECDSCYSSDDTVAPEPVCEACFESAPSDVQSAEVPIYAPALELPTYAPEPAEEFDTPTETEASTPAILQDEPASPLPPFTAPAEVSAPQEEAPREAAPVEIESAAAPAIDQPSDKPIVGDRYSGFSESTDVTTSVIPASPETPAPLTILPEQANNNAESSDDVFGEPSAPAVQENTANEVLPAPVETPTEQPPSERESDFDKLFGSPTQQTKPGEEEEEEAAAGLTFQPPSTSSQPEPATPDPAAPELAAPEPAAAEPANPQPSETEEEPQEEEDYDPFGEDLLGISQQHRILSAEGGLNSNANRIWSDNTASFRCEARLDRVTTKAVMLRRPSGKRLAVPFSRLAETDLQFVRNQISALRIVRAHDQAAEKLAIAWGL